MANIIIIIITTIAVMNTPQPALAPAGLVRLAGDHQACVQHLLHHQAPPHDHQNQGQVEPPPPPPAGQAHREEALLVKVKRGNFREGQKCNHTFLIRLGVFTRSSLLLPLSLLILHSSSQCPGCQFQLEEECVKVSRAALRHEVPLPVKVPRLPQ